MSIPTLYRNIEFRSRLEARWAAFFDLIGWQWVYEPVDGQGYIPDFLIQGDRPLFVEVKPAISDNDYHQPVAKAEAGLLSFGRDILIVGASPLPQRVGRQGSSVDAIAGLLGEYDDYWTPEGSYCWDTGSWIQCQVCKRINVFHELQSFTGRPCGHYDGDGHLGRVDRGDLIRRWAAATNVTKWRRR